MFMTDKPCHKAELLRSISRLNWGIGGVSIDRPFMRVQYRYLQAYFRTKSRTIRSNTSHAVTEFKLLITVAYTAIASAGSPLLAYALGSEILRLAGEPAPGAFDDSRPFLRIVAILSNARANHERV